MPNAGAAWEFFCFWWREKKIQISEKQPHTDVDFSNQYFSMIALRAQSKG